LTRNPKRFDWIPGQNPADRFHHNFFCLTCFSTEVTMLASAHHFLRVWLTVLILFVASAAHATFTDHGDGTVSDTLTGLIWDKCSWGQSGSACGSGSASLHTWAAAQGVAANARGLAYKGHNDWRLPNVAELESLVKIGTRNPSIDTAFFPNAQIVYLYCSSTINWFMPMLAWFVDFGSGDIRWHSRSFIPCN
jgi:hypothetical protein